MNDSSIVSKWQSGSPYLLSVLRIMSALAMIPSGTMILFRWPIAPPMPPVPVLSQTGIGGLIEFVCGVLLLLGLMTRPAAFLLSGTMAFAFFQFHFTKDWPTGIVPALNQGAPSYLFCFIFLYLSAAGAGPWSVDAMRRKSTP